MKQTRRVVIRTYFSKDEVARTIAAHSNAVRHYAFIRHDHDCDDKGHLKQVHCHVILLLNYPVALNQVASWFSSKTDPNVDVQPCRDVKSAFEYLIHLNNPEKFPYQSCDIVSDCQGVFLNSNQLINEDVMYMAFQDYLEDVPLTVLVRRYGALFIRSYDKFKKLAGDMGVSRSSDLHRLPSTFSTVQIFKELN